MGLCPTPAAHIWGITDRLVLCRLFQTVFNSLAALSAGRKLFALYHRDFVRMLNVVDDGVNTRGLTNITSERH